MILKTSSKNVWSNVFWYVKVYIFWNFIQHTINWDKTEMLKKVPSGQTKVTKNGLFFLSRDPTRHSFTFIYATVIQAEAHEKHTQFCSQTSLATRNLKIQWYLSEFELPKNWSGYKLSKLRESKFWVRHFYSIVTFK